ncbi:DUF4153 domain-containing protein [Planctomicrobium sp. SH668]|uniref:DUF4153 domain-containing protein n=1 Tax=Planctomicrobium sp. SH668 TaxID=3448126 RepID=UPI003F5C8379
MSSVPKNPEPVGEEFVYAPSSVYPRVRLEEFISLFLITAIADFSLWQMNGYAGVAIGIFLASLVIVFGTFRKRLGEFRRSALILVMAVFIAMRLLWCGHLLAVVCGLTLLAALSLSMAGVGVSAGNLWYYLFTLIPSGTRATLEYEKNVRVSVGKLVRVPRMAVVLQWVLPLFAAILFGVIFVMANPDIVNWLSENLRQLVERVNRWLSEIIDTPMRLAFWIAMFWIAAAMLRPWVSSRFLIPAPIDPTVGNETMRTAFYPAYRNTFMTLIALFAGYLCFEFWTMWTRTFPEGFYYAGYAHEGAFWLTVALGVATLTFSAIFQGPTFQDPRLPYLRRLGMIWWGLNLLLVVAVVNRMFIYIDFNGMTRMRVFGLLGIAAVAAGLILVAVKIWKRYSFGWLVRNQLLALLFAIYSYAVLPVDAFVMNYDVRQVLAGNPKPSVQIAHHLTSVEGKLMLFPLLKCDNQVIRDGIRVLLAQTRLELSSESNETLRDFQIAERRFREVAQQYADELDSADMSGSKWSDFARYSFQWY